MKIAIAGGSGEVAREVIDALKATNHELILLSRKEGHGLVKVDYNDRKMLEKALRGVDTVLSFITPQTDPGNVAQKNLIDASISAGVRRFAPSEWATSSFEHMPWYAGKGEMREYLKTKNIEYTLFQPGLFTNYFAHPYKSAKHVSTFQTQIDFENRRAIILDGKISLTTAEDLASIVVKAIDYQGKWPVVGGIKGCEMTVEELVMLGEEIRGPFKVDRLRTEDLKAGVVNSSWLPKVDHPAIPAEQADAMAGMMLAGMTLGISAGALNVSDEWNQIFSEYKFTQPREFLMKAWKGRP